MTLLKSAQPMSQLPPTSFLTARIRETMMRSSPAQLHRQLDRLVAGSGKQGEKSMDLRKGVA